MTQEDCRHRHAFKNQLSIILGFSELLLTEVKAGDTRRNDLEYIRSAATAALALLAHLYPEEAGTLR